MKGFSYVIPRDYGFAPNPFGPVCTLATCKPKIRNSAEPHDWIIGCGSAQRGLQGKLVFAMEVSEKLTFQAYWDDPKFFYKRPVMNGSLKQMYGDNIYHKADNEWIQEDSHHSHDGGRTNYVNLQTDTRRDAVIVSHNYYYFGGDAITLPEDISQKVIVSIRDYKHISTRNTTELIEHLKENYRTGINGYPALFSKFERFKGN